MSCARRLCEYRGVHTDEYMAHEEQMLSGLSARQAAQLAQLLLRLDASIADSATQASERVRIAGD